MTLPDMQGPRINPTENEAVMIDIPLAIFESSHIEYNNALTAITVPIEHPCRNLVVNAQYILVVNPKESVVNATNVILEMIVALVPFVSTIIPHIKLSLSKSKSIGYNLKAHQVLLKSSFRGHI